MRKVNRASVQRATTRRVPSSPFLKGGMDFDLVVGGKGGVSL